MISIPNLAYSQLDLLNFISDDTHDSTYVISYERFLIGRVFLSRRLTRFAISDRSFGFDINYRPNTTTNLGVGITYGKVALNISQGFSFLNPDNERGLSRWTDLQTRVYARRYILDIYGQFYTGFYLQDSDDTGVAGNPLGNYYIREDVRLQQIGLSFMYILNSERFSYRSSFTHNEWQQKSSGSILVGLEFYNGYMQGDSSLIPRNLLDRGYFNSTPITEVDYFDIGPSLGYAYTFVYNKYWFATGHFSGNLGIATVEEISTAEPKRNTGVYPNFLFRFVVGRNSPKWFAGLSMISNNTQYRSSFGNDRYRVSTTDIRFNVAMRFVPSPGSKRYLRILEDVGLAPK